jgi:Uma2 family endonuclease
VILMSSETIDTQLVERKTPPSGRVSFEEFLEWLDEDTRAEWVDGEIIIASPAGDNHQDIVDFLVAVMRPYVRRQQLGWIRSGPFVMRTVVRPSGREPDILFVVNERMNLVQKTYLDGPADLAVEIVSPESIGCDRGDKFVEYEAAGVREYWLIDPLHDRLEFYQLGTDGRYRLVLIGADGIYPSLVLPGFWLRVDWLQQIPLPDEIDVLRELGVI